ncbi:unnamed protein product [Adineta ricciae]|uniref:SAM domain-containing protein n=2 Tax=Adineta ricciae TaxID=249248 RepID=A0A815I427_ADIRI|nr:unnamed protein product [Adineta ricciae]
MSSETSMWMKFLHESDIPTDENTLSQYCTALSSRFTTIDELLTVNENDLINLGITNQYDRICLIKQAHLFDDKENLPLTRHSAASNYIHEHWLANNQSTPVNPQSKCSLSPALLSRISFNDHASCDDVTLIHSSHSHEHLQTPKRVDRNDKIQTLLESCQKRTPPASTRGLRAMKSLSDTIALQKKILTGNDRLKRLTLSRSLIKRQTALITKKVSNLTSKLSNPFAKKTNKNDLKAPEKPVQIAQQSKASSNENLLSHIDAIESKYTLSSAQTIPTRKFKLGAPTTFLTRSLANHAQKE